MRGYANADGYIGPQLRYKLSGGSVPVNVLRVANVEWMTPEWSILPNETRWGQVPDPLPFARLVGQAQVSTDLLADMAAVDVKQVALVSHEIPLSGAAAGTVRAVRRTTTQIEVDTESPGAQLLVVAESHHPGWRVEVDGVPAPLEKVYGDFMGCVVPGGSSTALFTFHPASLVYGKLGACLGLSIAAGAFILSFFPWRPSPARLGRATYCPQY